jgi:hypothetical protein
MKRLAASAPHVVLNREIVGGISALRLYALRYMPRKIINEDPNGGQ